VLKGADGIVFVADSQETMLGANVESFKNLEENLKAHGMKLGEMPHVIQFNKRDLAKLTGIEDLNAALNKFNAPFYESVATSGIGVQDTLKAIVKLVLLHLTRKYDPKSLPTAADRPDRQPMPATASASGSMPVAAPQAPAPAPRAERAPMPPAAAPAPVAAIPPAPRPEPKAAPSIMRSPAPAETMPPFQQTEIDDLVGEVGDHDAAPIHEEEVAPVAAAEAHDEGIWLGAPEGEDSFSGSNVSLEDMLTQDTHEAAPAPSASAWRETPAFGSGFEIDRGFDPEWKTPPAGERAIPVAARVAQRAPEPKRTTRADSDEPIAPFPIPAPGVEEDDASDDIVLTEVASDNDLFHDPTLDIAQLAAGAARDILVPVVLGEGREAKRFKLSIRLRLDPVD
jgi:hypothetical protein